MKAYTHIVADRSAGHSSVTRNAAGVSLPVSPWFVPDPEQAPQRKVTEMPATIRKVVQPKDAPAPIHKPHKYYTDKRIGETEEEWVARDWALRIRNEPQIVFTNGYACDGRTKQIAGKLAAHIRRQKDAYKSKRQAILDSLRIGGATSQQIMDRAKISSKGGMNEVLRGMMEAGQITREKVKIGPGKPVYVYTAATMKEGQE